MIKKLHLFHKWGPWALYEESGIMLRRNGTRHPYTETRQYRKCLICGRSEDAFVKNGPVPSWGGLPVNGSK